MFSLQTLFDRRASLVLLYENLHIPVISAVLTLYPGWAQPGSFCLGQGQRGQLEVRATWVWNINKTSRVAIV